MLVAEVAVAECAVADDALSCILALLEVATGFAGRHDDVFVRGGSRREGGGLLDVLRVGCREERGENSSNFESGRYIKDGWQCWSAKEGEGRDVA